MILQTINEWAQAHIDMPLPRFFTRVSIGLMTIMILVIIAAPMSFAKLIAMLTLFLTSMTTTLLAFGNYQTEKNDTLIGTLPETKEEAPAPEPEIQEPKPTLNKDFIV
jgi:hypothetical protein